MLCINVIAFYLISLQWDYFFFSFVQFLVLDPVIKSFEHRFHSLSFYLCSSLLNLFCWWVCVLFVQCLRIRVWIMLSSLEIGWITWFYWSFVIFEWLKYKIKEILVFWNLGNLMCFYLHQYTPIYHYKALYESKCTLWNIQTTLYDPKQPNIPPYKHYYPCTHHICVSTPHNPLNFPTFIYITLMDSIQNWKPQFCGWESKKEWKK